MNTKSAIIQEKIEEQIINILTKPRNKEIKGVPHISMAYKDEVKELLALISEAYQKGRESERKQFKKIINTEPSAIIPRTKEHLEAYQRSIEVRQSFREFLLSELQQVVKGGQDE